MFRRSYNAIFVASLKKIIVKMRKTRFRKVQNAECIIDMRIVQITGVVKKEEDPVLIDCRLGNDIQSHLRYTLYQLTKSTNDFHVAIAKKTRLAMSIDISTQN